MTSLKPRRVPVWILIIIFIVALPALLFPAFISLADGAIDETKKLFLWIFPFYLLVAAFLAWQCYGRRTLMTWILLVVMALTDIAMVMLLKL